MTREERNKIVFGLLRQRPKKKKVETAAKPQTKAADDTVIAKAKKLTRSVKE